MDPAAPILITMGEPAGIGPEVAIAAFEYFRGRVGARPLRLVGDPGLFASLREHVIPTHARAKAIPGTLDVANADAVTEAIELAVRACLKGEAAALVTAPIHKAVLNEAGFPFPGHTEFLAHLTGAPRAVMMLASEKLRVVPLTIHVPVAEVPGRIDQQAVFDTAEIMLTALRRDFGIAKPRLAVAGLTPHAGEDGMLGLEEERIIAPAIAALTARGFAVRGPLSADTLFHEEARL